MQGLLGDYLSEDPNKRDAQRAGLLNFGAQLLMNSNKGFAPALGSGLVGGSNAYQGTIQDQQKQALQAAQAGRQALEGRVLQQQLDQPGKIAEIIRAAGGDPQQVTGLPPQQEFAGDGGQSIIRQPQSDAMPQYTAPVAQKIQPQAIHQRYLTIGDRLADNGYTDQANKYYDLANKLAPKLKNQTQLRNAAGNVITANVYEDGRTEELSGFSPAEKLTFQNTGGSTVALDPFTGKPVNTIRNTQSPDSIASNAVSRENSMRTASTAARGTYDADRGVLVDTRTGLAIPVVGKDGAPLAGKVKPATEFQGKSASYGSRAQAADQIINELGTNYSPAAIASKQALGNVWAVGGALEAGANKALPAKEQKAEQAQRDFISAVLRQESGAAIADSEFKNARRQYFPQPGDSADVIAQKAANRALVIEGFRDNAGGHMQPAPKPKENGGWSIKEVK